MKIEPIRLTDHAWDLHESELSELATVMAGLCNLFGVSEPFSDGSEWTPERAEARLLSSESLTPVARAAVLAMLCVQRSLMAAGSHREKMLSHLIDLKSVLRDLISLGDSYLAARPAEVEAERILDKKLGIELHSEQREEVVAGKFRVWRDAMRAALRATADLIRTLHEERPVSLDAGMYSGKGGGTKLEFAMRLVWQGVHPNHAAVIRNDVRVFDPTLRSKAQQSEVRSKGNTLRREVALAMKRINALIS